MKVTSAWVVASFAVGAAGANPPDQPHADEGVPTLEAELLVLSGRYAAFVPYHTESDAHEFAFVFADTQGLIHHVVSDSSGLHENWRSFPIGVVKQVFVEDLDGDGVREIIAHGEASRIYVWDTLEYGLRWESPTGTFKNLQAMAIANVDSDQPLELVLAADNRIVYLDGVSFVQEKAGRDQVKPRSMLIADVDGDGVREIITNDGYVLDVRTITIEWSDGRGFGYPISLFDLDQDGVPEVAGEVRGTLRFWDLKNRRELWWPVHRQGRR